jgi:hypothetical protein
MSTRVQEKRREERRETSGVVHVRFSDPRDIEIEGQLMDISSNGFRMSHACASLEAGQLVEFSHFEAAGRARVMWNRILAERVESGFLVLAAQE